MLFYRSPQGSGNLISLALTKPYRLEGTCLSNCLASSRTISIPGDVLLADVLSVHVAQV